MRELLLSDLATVLTSGVITSLGSGSFQKYLRYLCALLLTLAILTPLGALLSKEHSFSDLLPTEQESAEAVPEAFLRQFESEVEKAASRLIEDEFSLPATDFQLTATAKDVNASPSLVHLHLTLYTLKGAAQTGTLKKRLAQACGCEVTVTEEIDR